MKTIIHMLVTLFVIGVISGGLLSQISGWAEPQIEAHKIASTQKAIFEVQPDAKDYKKVESVSFEVYEVMNDNKEVIGYALPYEGNGFQGKIRLMLGLTADLNQVVGLKVLEQVETPGLGTKIVNDPSNKKDSKWFSSQFNGTKTEPAITAVKNQKPSKDTEIQAITGATISSKSVVAIVNSSIESLRKALKEVK